MNILPRAENEQSGMKEVIELSRSDPLAKTGAWIFCLKSECRKDTQNEGILKNI